MPDYDQPNADVEPLSRGEVLKLHDELKGVFSARNADFIKMRALYDGEHWGDAVDNPTPAGYSLVANYVRPTVDRAVTDLLSRMPGIQVMPRGAEEEERRIAEGCEGLLYRTWRRSDAPVTFRRVLFNAVLYRYGLLYYWYDAHEKMVRFRSFSPSNFYPVYDGDDIVECIAVSRRLTRELKRRYPGMASQITADEQDISDGPSGVSSVASGITDALLDAGSIDQPRRNLAAYTTVVDWYDRYGNWVRVMGDASHTEKLRYGTGRIPFIEVLPNVTGDEVDPHSEVIDIAELNQYLDQLLSQQANIIKKYSDPPVIDQGSGVDPVRIKRTLSAEGGVLPIRKDGNIRFLNWEGTPPAIGEQFERVKNAIHDLSGRPRSAYGETATNQSGVLTNLSMSPTTSATENHATMLGMALIKLHEDILKISEKYLAGEDITFKGARPSGRLLQRTEYFESEVKGSEIAGWYQNEIKWPSSIRTDDPVFVQNIISQVTSDPPLLPVYDAVEMLGHEDAEALADRIQAQLEDPRYHPDRLKSAIDAAGALQGTQLPTGMEGFDATSPLDPGPMNQAAEAAGSPARSVL